ncbi:MAG: hypothetical protein A2297_04955 [Elusimicrobia bacterium RIFOXYB2_FULL_48_7]|nr:MAG: hypothetical protein A2297_04955 [Elusimicrobia bacterium RIFOXYB2_FULL_48_7]
MLKSAQDILTEMSIKGSLLPSKNDIPYLEDSGNENCKYHIGDFEYMAENISQNQYGIRCVLTMLYNGSLKNRNLISLYSSRARSEFLNKAKGVDNNKAEKHLLALEKELLTFLKKKQSEQKVKSGKQAPRISEEDKQKAMEFLKSPDLFEIIKQDVNDLGLAGESDNALLAYLIASSRKLSSPLSGIVKAQSSSGKSMLLKTIVSLMPEEETIDVSRITEQALFWMNDMDLKHKLLVIAEREGNNGNYAIRLLQSEKKLRLLAPQKSADDSTIATKWIEVCGPIALLESTTQTNIEIDNQTRVVELYVDETEHQTQLIQTMQKRSRTLEGMLAKKNAESIMQKHKNAQRLLENVNIMIPYANEISFPVKLVRSRRDCDKFLNLIEVVSFIRQFQKQVHEHGQLSTRYVEADLTDYEIAYSLGSKVLGQSMEELDKRSRQILDMIVSMVEEMSERNDSLEEATFVRKNILNYLKRSGINMHNAVLQKYIEPLVEAEYLELISGGKGKTNVFRLNATINDSGKIEAAVLTGLTTPAELEAKLNKSHKKKTQ